MRSEARIAALAAVLLVACRPDPVPKPRGYFRIDLAPKTYAVWAGGCPFEMEVPGEAHMVERTDPGASCWFDLTYPRHKATVHLTYRPVDGMLAQHIEDAHGFKGKHEAVAARILSERVLRDSSRVFGTLFNVDGDVASPMVFYLTDSTDHFLYGALYFQARPNADSLAPVTQRIREDVRHLAATLRWSGGTGHP
jgi:gliding motility-associated lipoprotein GldD